MDAPQKLKDDLKEILGNDNVYHIVPENFKMDYPCMKIELAGVMQKFADNKNYLWHPKWKVTHMYYLPEESLIKEMTSLQSSGYERQYISDNLIHDVYILNNYE